MKCFDVVCQVIDGATKLFSETHTENKDDKEILRGYCDAIDALVEEFDGGHITSTVTADKLIKVSFECTDISVYDENRFKELVRRSAAVRFEQTEGGLLLVEFVFPSIWNKK